MHGIDKNVYCVSLTLFFIFLFMIDSFYRHSSIEHLFAALKIYQYIPKCNRMHETSVKDLELEYSIGAFHDNCHVRSFIYIVIR